jgi:RNA polymerase sigma-70 factor (ECF subfamily)
VEASDSALIQRSLSGDIGAFDALMSRYQGLVFKVALTCTRNRDDALDICQNAFLKGYERLGSLRDGDRFKYWIARIAHREGINWARRNRRRGEPIEQEQIEAWPDAAPSQETRLLAHESGTDLSERLGRLNRRYRLAVSLRYFEGMSIAEVAAVLRCTEGVVKSMLFRSIRRLRQEMTEARQVS